MTRLVMPWGKAVPVMPGRSRNMGRYYGSGRDWETPPAVFDPLNAEFQFTLDVCAKPETAKVSRYFTEADDGLAKSWAGETCWMNPPYGREIYDWTAKAVAETRTGGCTVVGLLPASTDLEWWHRDVLGAEAEVRYLRGRVRFLQGERWVSGMFPSVVVVWRPRSSSVAEHRPKSEAAGSTPATGDHICDHDGIEDASGCEHAPVLEMAARRTNTDSKRQNGYQWQCYCPVCCELRKLAPA